jgi:fatty-acyl-CoA synthase
MTETESIRDTLHTAWSEHAELPALVTTNGVSSFGEIEDRTFRLANALMRLGVRAGDPVCCVFSTDFNVLTEIRLATYELGATLYAVPPGLLTGDQDLMRGVDPKVVIYDPRQVPGIPEWLIHVCPSAHALPARGPSGDYGGLLDAAPATPIDHAIDQEVLASVGFTSGTTGPPKGITATYLATAWSSWMMRRIFAAGDDHSEGGVLVGIPLFAAGGGLIVPALASGGTVYAPSPFDPVQALELMDSGQVTSAFLTPSMVIDLLDVPELDRYDLSRVRSIIYGTSIMPVPKLEEAIRRIGPVFVGGYGMAEVLPPVTVLYREEHGTAAEPAIGETLSSVGRPVLGVKVRVMDDTGQPLGAFGIGEVEVRSPAVTRGYWGDVARTRAANHDGWWRSGDVGYLDDDRRLHILSRMADVLWWDGDAVYPRHLEEACSLHPDVKEACAVQATPNSPIVVAVSLRTGSAHEPDSASLESQIHDLVSQHLQDRVKVDDIMVFDEIPRSVQGKVLHREVRGAISVREGGAWHDQTVDSTADGQL